MTSPIGGTGPRPISPDPEHAPEAPPEIAGIGERVDALRRIPWRAEIRAVLETEHKLLEVRDYAVATFRALLSSPLDVPEERARLLAERDPGIEIKTTGGAMLATNEMADGGRYVKLQRPHGRSERPLDITEIEVLKPGPRGTKVQLGVHDTRGPLGFRNADLVARTLAEAGAIVDAAQASPLAREDARSLPRLGLLEGKLGEVAREVSRLDREMRAHPELGDVRRAYRAALNAKKEGDGADVAFRDAVARVREALPRLGLAPDLARLVREELDLCNQIRDKWVGWHRETGLGYVIVP